MVEKWLRAYEAVSATLGPGPETAEACCVFARLETEQVFGAPAVARAPLCLWHLFKSPVDGSIDPFGPVTALVVANLVPGPVVVTYSTDVPKGQTIGQVVAAKLRARPGVMAAAQGWRGSRPFATSGHTIRILVLPDQRAVIFDSAAKRAGNGNASTHVVLADYLDQFTGGLAFVWLW